MQSSLVAYAIRRAQLKAMVLFTALAACLAFAVPAVGNAADAKTGMDMHNKEKVIFQVSEADPKTWNLALNNVKNVQQALGKDKVDVEVVAYGPGIGMLKMDSTVGNRVNDALAAGVKVVACENTMHKLKLSKDDMLGQIGYVPAGVIELMQRQKQGYAYIRP